jgi:serine/threonine-protein kinase RsbW
VIVRGKAKKQKITKSAMTRAGSSASDFLLKLELESNPESLCLVRATIERTTETLHFEPAETRAIVRAVDEALANVVRHAYKGQRGQPIQLTCRRLRSADTEARAKGIEIILQDSGVALDPAKLKGRPLDEIRPGGLGLHFMRQSMDKVEFSRSQGQNQLRLVKYQAPAKPEKTQGD